jgi:hypothetical protein
MLDEHWSRNKNLQQYPIYQASGGGAEWLVLYVCLCGYTYMRVRACVRACARAASTRKRARASSASHSPAPPRPSAHPPAGHLDRHQA